LLGQRALAAAPHGLYISVDQTLPEPCMPNPLFRPFNMAGLQLPNRVVMAPMTRSFSPNGVPGADVAAYYRVRAEGEVGLIVTEGTGIDRVGSVNDPNIPRFHGDAALAGWGNVVKEVHAVGGLIAPQLWHVGAAINHANPSPPPQESPSGLFKPGKAWGEKMSESDIADTVAAFAKAAGAAKKLGFDTIELHGAHGYLIDQFFWTGTNERSDSWNGDTIAQRGKFAAEILKAVRAEVGADYPVIIRISQWKQQAFDHKVASSPAELEAWLAPMSDAGADVFHCSQRRFWEPEFPDIDGEEGLNFAGWAKKLSGKPTISVGSVGLSGEFIAAFAGEASQPASIENLLERMDRDEFDLIAVGRALIVDPDWVAKVRAGRFDDLRAYDRKALATLA
jgi:2,4-dienoyl-CoA reductase-like NADH-dependent reductase (Old Yellow Enzyme family)